MHDRYLEDLLDEQPTLSASQADDLKYEDTDTGVRVWLSRVGEGVTVEHRSVHGHWFDATEQYGPYDVASWVEDAYGK